MVSLTKAQANVLTKILEEFARDKKVVEFVKENSEESSCIRSLDDAITATKAASDIIIESSTELDSLINTYGHIQYERDISTLIRGAATMLKQMDVFVPRLG